MRRKGHAVQTDSDEAQDRNAGSGADVDSQDGDVADLPQMTEDHSSAIATAEDLVADLERELADERDRHLRLAAEFDNYRKRMLRERLEAETRGMAELAKALLEPLDDIARFAHVDPAETEPATIFEGLGMVERKLAKLLKAAGLEQVDPVDEPFDPSLHEAVATAATDSPDQDGSVAQVYQVGYTFKGQLLRPARVVVRQYQGAA